MYVLDIVRFIWCVCFGSKQAFKSTSSACSKALWLLCLSIIYRCQMGNRGPWISWKLWILMYWRMEWLLCLYQFKIKRFFSFKKRCIMTNLGLVCYNEKILYAAVGAPGSTHNTRLLKKSIRWFWIWDSSHKWEQWVPTVFLANKR